LEEGAHFPGVFIVDDQAPLGVCIEDILLVADCSKMTEWRNHIYYLPLK